MYRMRDAEETTFAELMAKARTWYDKECYREATHCLEDIIKRPLCSNKERLEVAKAYRYIGAAYHNQSQKASTMHAKELTHALAVDCCMCAVNICDQVIGTARTKGASQATVQEVALATDLTRKFQKVLEVIRGVGVRSASAGAFFGTRHLPKKAAAVYQKNMQQAQVADASREIGVG